MAGFAMWSLGFAQNPLDFVSNSSSLAFDRPDLARNLLGANPKSVDSGGIRDWETLGNQSRLNTEVLHLLSLPEDAEVCRHLYTKSDNLADI